MFYILFNTYPELRLKAAKQQKKAKRHSKAAIHAHTTTYQRLIKASTKIILHKKAVQKNYLNGFCVQSVEYKLMLQHFYQFMDMIGSGSTTSPNDVCTGFC